MKQKFSKKMMTDALQQLACEAQDITADGDVVTKAAKLAQIVWEHALGFEITNPNSQKTTVVTPQVWAINLLYDRLEGRVTASAESGKQRTTSAERLSVLSKSKLNKLAEEKSK